MLEVRAVRELASRLCLHPERERLLPVRCRLVPALTAAGTLVRARGRDGERYFVAPDWACFAGRALHDARISPRDYENAVLALRTREDLRAAVVSAWLLVELEDRDPREAVRSLLLAELGL